MIREFICSQGCKSINWVDDDNRLVGFDYEVECCENFGYFFSKAETTEEAIVEDENQKSNEFPKTGMENARFAKKNPEIFDSHAFFEIENSEWKFLVLYNFHNGYYAHGFSVSQNGKEIFFDSI